MIHELIKLTVRSFIWSSTWIVQESTAYAVTPAAFSLGLILLCLRVCVCAYVCLFIGDTVTPIEEVCVCLCLRLHDEGASGNYRTHRLSNEMSAAWLPLLSLITHHYREQCAHPPLVQQRSGQVKPVSCLTFISLFIVSLLLVCKYAAFNIQYFHFYRECDFALWYKYFKGLQLQINHFFLCGIVLFENILNKTKLNMLA